MHEKNNIKFVFIIFLIIQIISLFIISYPLIIFSLETYENPNLINITAVSTQLNETHMKVLININYKGNIILKNFSIKINNSWYKLGDITKGNHSYSLILELKPARLEAYSFLLGGIYKVRIGEVPKNE